MIQDNFKFKDVGSMTEEHLCRTIAFDNETAKYPISDERKQDCRAELMRRWAGIRRTSRSSTSASDIISSITA